MDTALGIFLFKDPSCKMTLKDKCLSLTFSAYLLLFILLTVPTLIITNFKMIHVIFCVSLLTLMLLWCFTIKTFMWNKSVLQDLFEWCESLYDVKKKFHDLIKETAEIQLVVMEKRSLKMIYSLRTFIYVDAFIVTIGFAFIGTIFLPENIYPKYSTPLPYFLPFTNQDTWIAFGTNLIAQTVLVT